MKHFGDFFRANPPHELAPHRDWLDGVQNDDDVRRPFLGATEEERYVAYIPDVSPQSRITISHLGGRSYRARLFNPRSGDYEDLSAAAGPQWTSPVVESGLDWVIILDSPSDP